MPRLSVVLPTRNRSERLARAVASVLASTERDLEVVVVDDASDDDTPAVLEDLSRRDSRVRPVRLDARVGAAGARQAGIERGASDYLAFLDDDDEWLATKAQRQLEFLAASPGTAAVACNYEIRTEAQPGRPPPPVTRHVGPARATRDELLWCNFVGGASVMMLRRSAFEELPRFAPDLVTCEDWDFALQCAHAAPVVVLPEVQCRYTVHLGGRLTRADRLLAGREAFVAKHTAAMPPRCLAYHHARLRILAESVRRSAADRADGADALWNQARLALELLRSTPPRVSAILAVESVTGRLGQRAGDPGRSLRRLHRLVSPG